LLNIGADAVVVFEHPDKIVISHTLRTQKVPLIVVEPAIELAIDCILPVDVKLIPSLFIVAHWSWSWIWV
jgi:hypothetical protein